MPIHAQNEQKVMLFPPQSIATSATQTGTVDTLGWEHVQIYVQGDTASSDIATLKVSEGTNTSASNDIATYTGGTAAGNFTIPSADTSNGVSVLLDIPKEGRERYLKLHLTPGATQVAAAVAILSRGKVAADTAAERGVDTYQDQS